MRRSSFQRRSALFSSPARVAFVAALVLALLVLVFRLVAPGAFFSAATPLFGFGSVSASGAQGFLGAFADAAEREARILALEQEVRALSNQNLLLAARLADVDAFVEPSEEVVMAGVIARPPLAPYDLLILGKGSEDGVVAGALVTGEGGVPLGTISSVSANTAQVNLFSMPGRATEGWVGEERVPVTLHGKGAGAFVAEAPRDANIVSGAIVYLPGPGALPAGRIREVETDPSSPSATLRIEPLVNIFSLTTVAVRRQP